ncbi:hypothetical protein CTI12_AA101440 [Artemisia annua]|uniref:Homologous recombination OB-fold protein OB-fold domain-containing protein n=1 Tax=Artemisia annua TaxID=35608 RepID=A0A2U1N3B8_ARTAN|nr:hypothetical protein CTI12_AA101440 [Artemisia annua]
MNSQPHDSTEIQNDDISGEASVRIIPGPAGVYQRVKLRKIADTREGFDDDFTRGPWLSAIEYANANGWVVYGCLGDIKSYIKKGKVDLVFAIIKSCTPNALGDLTVTLKDLSGSLSGTIHHKIINEGGYGKDVNIGAALILRNISVFSPKSGHYLNITMKNLVKVFKKDTPPGSSEILDEEKIMKLLEEEEMPEIELQIRGNVNDDEIQHTQDEEALNLAMEEEARYARIDEERLQQEEEEFSHASLITSRLNITTNWVYEGTKSITSRDGKNKGNLTTVSRLKLKTTKNSNNPSKPNPSRNHQQNPCEFLWGWCLSCGSVGFIKEVEWIV